MSNSGFNIEYDDSLIEEVRSVVSLGEEAFNCGLSEGIEKGIEIGLEKGQDKWIDTVSDSVVHLCKEEGWTQDKAIDLFNISDDDRSRIEAEVKRKMEIF